MLSAMRGRMDRRVSPTLPELLQSPCWRPCCSRSAVVTSPGYTQQGLLSRRAQTQLLIAPTTKVQPKLEETALTDVEGSTPASDASSIRRSTSE